ncbi:MAG TPA: FAD:protein FMN transferase [Candidatus Udaeobacter sp.]|jgi:thiamine biosynthesis lipoprotein|nr:FAD:protein FMN transferase [Candidatus Udaeobacter sp.]
MRLPSGTKTRRCRPLLGTLVDIASDGSPEVVNRAFAAIEEVHQLMSFHDPTSDVARINRDASHQPVKIHSLTWHVLKYAEELSFNSNGVFDITIGRELVKLGYLPEPNKRSVRGGNWKDIILDNKCEVRFRRPLIIDLGGIAKGFAVDRAVKALKDNGVTSGIVNAGGDLRVFGPSSQLVCVRHPAAPIQMAAGVRLRERAVATSGIYFERRRFRGKYIGPLLDGCTRRASRAFVSATVGAAECMTADALTKIVFALRERAVPLLARYNADALLLEGDGAPSWMFHPPCDTSLTS